MISLILTILISICTIYSYIPQLIQLLKFKSSRDINLQSYIISIIICILYLIYYIIYNNDTYLIFLCLIQVILLIWTTYLIIIYKK